jgi:hypothetical protein
MSGVLPITVILVSFSSVNTAIPTSTKDPGYVYETTAVLPTASGTISDCSEYEDAPNWTTSCWFLTWSYKISSDQLFSWNPNVLRVTVHILMLLCFTEHYVAGSGLARPPKEVLTRHQTLESRDGQANTLP